MLENLASEGSNLLGVIIENGSRISSGVADYSSLQIEALNRFISININQCLGGFFGGMSIGGALGLLDLESLKSSKKAHLVLSALGVVIVLDQT